MPNGLRVFSGTANPQLAADICLELTKMYGERRQTGVVLGSTNHKQFADGEMWVEYKDNIRDTDLFIVQPTCAPVNDNLMQLILMIDAAKRASPKRITVVNPYYGYARQDRKDRPRVPISAKRVASMIEDAGADRILTMDLHSAPIQGFFEIPVDHLYALPVFIDDIKKRMDISNLVIVSPDAGGTARARLLSMKLNVPLVIVDKYREAANVSEVQHVIGEVNDRDCLLVDDIIDTAGTLCKAANALMLKGAKSVSAIASHGLFSYDRKEDISAIDKIERSVLSQVVVTNTIPQDANLKRILRNGHDDDLKTTTKIKCTSVAKLIAEGVKAIHEGESISGLFI